MSIQVYSTALYLGEVNTEGQLAWITDDSGQKVGRVEIDWGDDTNVDHLAYVYKGEECIANISLDRYMADVGQINGMLNDMPAYRISKIALNGLTLILADWVRGSNVLVNAAHPGWVKTDMGGPNAVRRPEDAARGILWLSTLPEGGPNGGFFVDGKPFPW